MNRRNKILMISIFVGATAFTGVFANNTGSDVSSISETESMNFTEIYSNVDLAWDLDSCIRYARENNISVLKSALSVDESQVDLKEAKAALFPSLTFSSNQNMTFDNDAEKNQFYSGSYSLDASMNLYAGGKNLKNIKQQKLSIESSRYNYLATANSIELSIIKAYYQVLYANESVLTNREIAETSLKQLERSTELYNIGKISKVELSQIESQYKTDVYQVVLAETTLEENILNLKQLLQLDTNEPFSVLIPEMSEKETLAMVPDKNEVINIAYSFLPELRAAATDVEIAKLSTEMAKAERLPSVSLKGSIGSGTNSIASDNWGKQFSNGLNEVVGISVNVPIFNNRQVKSKIERARINTINTELTLDNSKLEIANVISSIHLDAISSQSRFDAANAQVEAAEQSYDLVNEKYSLGMLNAVDILVEKNNLLNAKQEMIQAKYNSLLNLRLLEFYMNQK